MSERYILSDHPQGTDLWKQDRAGKATGSRAADILAKIKSGEAAARRDYRVQLAVERLTGAPAEDGYINKEMEWGTAQEPFSRMAFEAATGLLVQEAGFAYLPDIQAGCSVDGFIDDDGRKGLFETKSPKSATHVNYLLAGRLPPQYEPQVTFNMWITGARFADFASFDPRMPEGLQLFRIRVERDDKRIAEIQDEVTAFLAEVDTLVAKLNERKAQ